MRPLLRLLNGIRTLFRRRVADTELDAELRAFLETAVDEKMRGGMSREQATRAARLELGLVSIESVKDRVRDVGWESTVESVARDALYAVRTLRNAPGFATVAVLTLALGIGANTTIFSLIDALMLRQLPVRDPDQLVVLTRIQGGQTGESFSYPQVTYLAERDDLFAGLCGFAADTFHIGPSEALETTAGAWVTGEYYPTLGITPIIGRLLGPDDDRPGAPPAAVITDAYWSRKFARGPDVIGRTLLIEGVPVSIVGVTPAGFSGAIVGDAADITLAIGAVPQVQPEQGWKVSPGGRWLKVLARAREGLPRDALAAGLAVHWSRYLQATLNPSLPADARSRALSATLGLRSGATGSSPLRNEFQRPLLVLMAAVGLVLLVACVNMANLLLARAASRDRELTLRSALGASRGRLVRQLLTESALLAALGALLSVVMASWGSGVLIQLMSTGSTGPDAVNPIALDVGPNWHVLTFATLAAVVTTLLFGMAPAWRVTFTTPAAAMNAASPRLVRPGGRVARLLVAAQVAISLPLLIGAGLFTRTLDNLRTLDRGFRHEDVLLIDVDARRTGKDKPTLRAFYQQTLGFVEQLPGVKAASLSAVTPLMGGGISMPIAVNGQPVGGEIGGEMHFNVIGPRYFEVLGTPFVLGRDFTNRDDATAPRVAIVNQAFVRQHMKDVAPLGLRVSVVGSPQEMQVVGVVRDAVYESLRQTPPATVYAAYLQSGVGVDTATFEIHAPESLAQVATAIRAEVQPKLAGKPIRIRTLTGQLERGLVRERLMTTLASTFGVLALSLAVVGMYGVLAFNVARRTGEIGVRIALGARQSQVLGEILHEAGRMVALGIVIGLPIAWMASKVVSSMLFGVTGHDTVTIVVSIAVVACAAFLAAFLPARRAASVDPLVAIRCE
jgi:putative ABC transport system permease protein